MVRETSVETSKYGTIITAIGQQKITAAILHGEKVKITHGAVGDGGGAYYKPTEAQTALIRECWRGEIACQEINEAVPNMIDVEFIVPADVGGFPIREASLLDQDGDTIAICNTPTAEKSHPNEGISLPLPVIMHILVSNTSAVTFAVNPVLHTVSRREMELALKRYAAGVGSAINRELIIPITAWVPDVGVPAGFAYTALIPLKEALQVHVPSFALSLESLSAANAAGMCPTMQTEDGSVRFWAKRIPSADLSGTLQLRSENLLLPEDSSGAASDQEVGETIKDVFGNSNIATDEDVKDTVEDIFGENAPSDPPTEDDTSGKEDTPEDDNVASDKEVSDTINGIFGGLTP